MRREQRTQELPTRGRRVSVSNERHCMVLHLDTFVAPDDFWLLIGCALTGRARADPPLPAAAFSANHQSWHEQPQRLDLAIPQKGPLLGQRFGDKKSPRSIDRGRGAQE